jgi:thioredoxin 1
MVMAVSDQNFEAEVINESKKPVLIEFWATWCYPCKAQGPILDEISKELGEKAKVAKLEVDENPVVSGKYSVLSIPTLMMFKEGKMVWQGVGLHQKNILLSELNKHVS